MKFTIVPMHLRDANFYVEKFHRHHGPVVGAKFSIGAMKDGQLCGVAIVGRPVARHMDDGCTLEVNRLCTDGVRNASSFLYAASWRAAQALGYMRLITYTLATESGSSLKASGYRIIGQVKGRSWNCPSRPRVDKTDVRDRTLWEIAV